MAPHAFNATWTLLDASALSRDQEEAMIATAFAQRYHWYQVGDPRNRAIADWQVSRVAAVLGYEELALRFGESSLKVAADHDLGPFITGFAHEAIARAAAVVDDVATFTDHVTKARSLLAEIIDQEERKTLEADLAQMSEG